MAQFHYLLALAACLAVTLPLEFVFAARVYRRPRRLLRALAGMLLVFLVWDWVGIVRGHWSYSPVYTTGILLPFGIPLEEALFFVVVPICGLLTYEAVGTVLSWLQRRRSRAGVDA